MSQKKALWIAGAAAASLCTVAFVVVAYFCGSTLLAQHQASREAEQRASGDAFRNSADVNQPGAPGGARRPATMADIFFGQAAENSKRDVAQAQCKHLAEAVRMYRLDQENNPAGELPSSWDDLVNDPRIGLNPDALMDPWGEPYHLSVPGQHNNKDGFDVWSDCGGNGDPVGNW